MIDGASAIALATALGAAGPLRLAAAWAVCSLVVSIVVGFMLHVGHGARDVSAPEQGSEVLEVVSLTIEPGA
jgi:hypothetical protein